jgi:hypothetical protein
MKMGGGTSALLAATWLAAAGVAYAAPPKAAQPSIESELVRAGVAAYEDLDYPRCVSELQGALAETLTRAEKIVTYKTLGFCHVALNQPHDARTDFEKLLRLDENFELDRSVSPRIRAPFEAARAAVATGQAAGGGFTVPMVKPQLLPARPKEGQAVMVSVAYPGGVAERIELFYRTRGQAVFSRVAGEGKADGRFLLTVPGMNVHAPALEYYLVLLDEADAAVARAGTLGQPLALDVEARKRPIYTKAWFWGVIGGIAAAGAIVGAVVATQTGSEIGKNTPATVTIQPQ